VHFYLEWLWQNNTLLADNSMEQQRFTLRDNRRVDGAENVKQLINVKGKNVVGLWKNLSGVEPV
jgi:hypothetical protein